MEYLATADGAVSKTYIHCVSLYSTIFVFISAYYTLDIHAEALYNAYLTWFYLLMSGLGRSEDRLNYTIKCKSPGVVHVSWEVTYATRKDDLVVNTQYTCYNSTSQTAVRIYL